MDGRQERAGKERQSRLAPDVDWESFLAPLDMEWVVKPDSWNDGAFIGNGLLGAMIYGEEHSCKRHVLRLVAGRTDVTAVRTDRSGFPPRVPVGELELELEGWIYHPTNLRLELWNAELGGCLTTTKGQVRIRALAHAREPVLAIELAPDQGEARCRVNWVEHANVDPILKNADGINLNQYIPEVRTERFADVRGTHVSVQMYQGGGGCVAAWKERSLPDSRRVCYLSLVRGCGEAAVDEAAEAVLKAASAEYGEWVERHRSWWHDYYPQSFVSIPDKHLESFYWIQMYKLASATRPDAPLIDNQGPWLAPSPWPGCWFNMNVQMSYSPVYTSNRLSMGDSLVRTLEEAQLQLQHNVPEEFRHDSAGLGRSSSFDLAAPVEDEVGNLTWICHNLWRHYRHAMDDDLLRRLLYPLLRRSIGYYLHLLEEGGDGLLHLPPAISPEYGSFTKTRVRDCHYDLALLRWGCGTLLTASERLGLENDPLQSRWQEVLERLAPFPQDETGLMIGRSTPLAYGHRHFSHLMAVFPLHLLDSEREEDHRLIARSLAHWIGKEGDLRGFSMTGAASVAAALGRGSEAYGYLKALMHMIKPNTMYKEAGPVMETPLAAAEAIQDMLLQSWGGVIRVFPAVPAEWSEAVFHDFRAEGAFLVSALRRCGTTQWIVVKSLAGEQCRIRTDWRQGCRWRLTDSEQEWNVDLEQNQGVVSLPLACGQEAVLYQDTAALKLQAGPAAGSTCGPVRPFGGSKPWRLYGFPVSGSADGRLPASPS
jgi:hypothetical protein